MFRTCPKGAQKYPQNYDKKKVDLKQNKIIEQWNSISTQNS